MERGLGFSCASNNHLRESLLPSPNPGPDYVEIMREAKAIGFQKDKVDITSPDGKYIDEADSLFDKAYSLFKNQFQIYMHLILALVTKNSEPIIVHCHPRGLPSGRDGDRFMYDVLYTKATWFILSRHSSPHRHFFSTISTLVIFASSSISMSS
ncbi:hypothetical protein AAG906_022832 [Vitis piasezkii]